MFGCGFSGLVGFLNCVRGLGIGWFCVGFIGFFGGWGGFVVEW